MEYKDIITYELADGVNEEQLLSIAHDVHEGWMKNQPGFISWEINQNNDSSYTDIVIWKSKEHAKKAEMDMMNIPNGRDWFNCYKEGSIKSSNLQSLRRF